MKLLETLLSSAQGGAVQQAAGQLGLSAENATALISQLGPALAAGLRKNASSEQGLQGLKKALSGGKHERYLDEPGALESAETLNDGNAILGHLFGSKEVSRNVAGRASTQTGLDVGVIKKFLPLAAAAAMGAMSKQTGRGSSLSQADSQGALGMLSGLLDSDDDGQIFDDLLSLGRKLL